MQKCSRNKTIFWPAPLWLGRDGCGKVSRFSWELKRKWRRNATNITQLLEAWNQGDQDALAKVTPPVCSELHRLAHGYLAGERR